MNNLCKAGQNNLVDSLVQMTDTLQVVLSEVCPCN